MRSRPALIIVGTFVALIVIGAGALRLSGLHRAGREPDAITALFTATSAVCVTGLTVVDLATETDRAGRILVLVLIQVGGLGVLTLSNWALLSLRGRLGLQSVSLTSGTLGEMAGSSPGTILHGVVVYTFLCEIAGSIVLFLRFAGEYPWKSALWLATFHAVSAFCNAGFSLFTDGLVRYRGDPIVCGAVIFLVVAGGIGFVAAIDVTASLRAALRHRRRRLAFHTTAVLRATGVLIAAGTLLALLFEWGNVLRHEAPPIALLQSLFLSVTARTAGFHTVPTEHLTNLTLSLVILLMIIGASPGSTGGGVKTTGAVVLWAILRSHFLSRPRPEVFGRSIPQRLIAKSLALFVLYGIAMVAALLLLQATEFGELPHDTTRGMYLENLFEVVSALSTVGLSAGSTRALSDAGLTVIMTCMLVGRVGPLVVAASLIGERARKRYAYPQGDLMIG